MPNLTDTIEEYIKKMLALSSNRHIEIKRRELAGKFSCVPSQINYVLERRFPLERGYLVESRRGGSGWIRIYRIEPDQLRSWRKLVEHLDEERFQTERIKGLLKRMVEEKIISRRESMILNALLNCDLYSEIGLSEETVHHLQKRLFMSALREMLKPLY